MRRRALITGLACLLVFQTGCAGGSRVLTRDELVHPKPAKSYQVSTVHGETFTFIALHVEGEWLEGTIRVTTEQMVGTGEEARVAVSNRYQEKKIPWSEVETVEADYGSKAGGGAILAAASVLVGVGAFLLLTSGSESGDGGGGGKGF